MARFVIVLEILSVVISRSFAQSPCKSTVDGELRVEHFDSKRYGRQMTVRVWLPPGYGDPANAPHKYASLYLLDGQTVFDE